MLLALLYSLFRLLLDLLLLLLRCSSEARLQSEVLLLRHQLRVLQRQSRRPRWQPGDRLLLAALRLPRPVWASFLVSPETILRWHRELVRRKWDAFGRRPRRRLGRPPLPTECQQLILRLARENPGWGFRRIKGELRKLGYQVSATSIRGILRRHRVPPAPRRAGLSWQRFLPAQAGAVLACDFFSVDSVWLKQLYVMFFIELASRRVFLAGCTEQPTAAWVSQQARNLSWELGQANLRPKLLIHDRDSKFVAGFDEVFRSEGVRVATTPDRAPSLTSWTRRSRSALLIPLRWPLGQTTPSLRRYAGPGPGTVIVRSSRPASSSRPGPGQPSRPTSCHCHEPAPCCRRSEGSCALHIRQWRKL